MQAVQLLDRHAGLFVHLKRADHALEVIGMKLARAFRIDRGQAGMYRRVPLLPRHPLIFFPHGKIGFVAGKSAAFYQRVHIQTGSARDNRYPAARQNVLCRRIRQFHIARNGKRLVRRTDIQHVMRNALPLPCGRLGCADVHSPDISAWNRLI